jgi:hypothetical protein
MLIQIYSFYLEIFSLWPLDTPQLYDILIPQSAESLILSARPPLPGAETAEESSQRGACIMFRWMLMVKKLFFAPPPSVCTVTDMRSH